MVKKRRQWSTCRSGSSPKLTTSRGSSLAHSCQVWSTSISAFVSYPVYRMTDGIWVQIFGLIQTGYLLDLSKYIVDALCCWHLSFRNVWYKSAVDGIDCIRNANKCPKIPYSAMLKKMIRNPRADPDHCQKVTSKRVTHCPCLPSVVDVRFCFIILFTEWQTEWQNDHD